MGCAPPGNRARRLCGSAWFTVSKAGRPPGHIDPAPPWEVSVSKRITVTSIGLAATLVVAWSTTGQAAQGNSIPDLSLIHI